MRSLFAVLVLFLCTLVAGASRAEVVIGVYSDAGTSCSFSGNNAGIMTAHVVVRTNGEMIRGVRFKAPIPSCFDAVWLTDSAPDGLLSIGESPTGISIAIPGCTDLPTAVLDITYYTSGGTAPCCEFPLLADPVVGYLEALDCNYASIPMQALTSYMNADSTCACSVPPTPPNPPAVGHPVNGATSVNQTLVLLWTGSDPNSLDLTCDLYFGTTPDPPLLASDLVGYGSWNYGLPRLFANTVYYWKVVARNSAGAETAGPVWQFTTWPNVLPVVTLNAPANGATGVSLTPLLTWTGTDGTPLTYDVYLGTNPGSLPAVATNLEAAQYSATSLATLTTYHWRVVARDIDGGEGTSVTRSFTTRPSNYPPNVPQAPSPAHNATNVSLTPTMTWSGGDPDGHPVTYDVYLGTSPSPPLVASNISIPYQPSLLLQTTYYWRIVARDTGGLTTSGPVWFFATKANTPPGAPSNPTPAHNAMLQPLNSTLSWTCTDVEGQAITYDVYFGVTSPPPLVSSNQPNANFDPGPQEFESLYFWRIVAHDTFGAQTTGPLWFYRTKSPDDPPVFQTASPIDGAINVATNTTLQWNFTDPEGEALTYDVYFGNDPSPPLVASDITGASYNTGPLTTVTYYRWRIVARDPAGHETSMAVRSFITTSVSGGAPLLPSSPSPPHNGNTASTTPLLSWQGGDPDGDPLHYEVYLTIGGGSSLEYLGTTTSPSFQVQQVLTPGVVYFWYVMAYDDRFYTQGPLWSFIVGDSPSAAAPSASVELTLHQNVPNPFNPQTTIRYELPSPARVRLMIVDVNGRRVRTLVNEQQTAGPRDAVWNGRDDAGVGVSSGVYFYVLEAGKERLTRKLVLLK